MADPGTAPVRLAAESDGPHGGRHVAAGGIPPHVLHLRRVPVGRRADRDRPFRPNVAAQSDPAEQRRLAGRARPGRRRLCGWRPQAVAGQLCVDDVGRGNTLSTAAQAVQPEGDTAIYPRVSTLDLTGREWLPHKWGSLNNRPGGREAAFGCGPLTPANCIRSFNICTENALVAAETRVAIRTGEALDPSHHG